MEMRVKMSRHGYLLPAVEGKQKGGEGCDASNGPRCKGDIRDGHSRRIHQAYFPCLNHGRRQLPNLNVCPRFLGRVVNVEIEAPGRMGVTNRRTPCAFVQDFGWYHQRYIRVGAWKEDVTVLLNFNFSQGSVYSLIMLTPWNRSWFSFEDKTFVYPGGNQKQVSVSSRINKSLKCLKSSHVHKWKLYDRPKQRSGKQWLFPRGDEDDCPKVKVIGPESFLLVNPTQMESPWRRAVKKNQTHPYLTGSKSDEKLWCG